MIILLALTAFSANAIAGDSSSYSKGSLGNIFNSPEMVLNVASGIGTLRDLAALRQTSKIANSTLAPIFQFRQTCATMKIWPTLDIDASVFPTPQAMSECKSHLQKFNYLYRKVSIRGNIQVITMFVSGMKMNGSLLHLDLSSSIRPQGDIIHRFQEQLRDRFDEQLVRDLEKLSRALDPENRISFAKGIESPSTVTIISQALMNGSMHLEAVDINFGDYPEQTNLLCGALISNPELSTVYLRSGKIGRASLEALASLPKLRRLGLKSGDVTMDGARFFADMADFYTNLEYLDLSYNWLGDDILPTISVGIMRLPNLHTVILSGNAISPKGAKYIAIGLPHWKGVNQLKLDYNVIGNSGLLEISQVLQETNITDIDFSFNCMSSWSAKRFIKRSKDLFSVSLEGNKLDDRFATALLETLPSSRLRTLRIGHHCFSNSMEYGVRRYAETHGLTLHLDTMIPQNCYEQMSCAIS